MIEEVSKKTSVYSQQLTLQDLEPRAPFTKQTFLDVDANSSFLKAGWFKQIGIRFSYSNFIHRCKSLKDNELLQSVREYNDKVESSFFKPTPLSRINSLYSGYQTYPKLTGQFVTELSDKKNFERETVWKSIHDTSEYNWLQFIEFIETRSRINIIKCALEYAQTINYKPVLGKTLDWSKLQFLITPLNFQAGLDALMKHPQKEKVPYLLQVFVENFGGFYHQDKNELDLLSVDRKIQLTPYRHLKLTPLKYYS